MRSQTAILYSCTQITFMLCRSCASCDSLLKQFFFHGQLHDYDLTTITCKTEKSRFVQCFQWFRNNSEKADVFAES